ncbi:hypothetical protein NW754_011946 [Fusarium falciforme]|nr:hypothetical protein NW754_011946 [Fusarium falciforme]
MAKLTQDGVGVASRDTIVAFYLTSIGEAEWALNCFHLFGGKQTGMRGESDIYCIFPIEHADSKASSKAVSRRRNLLDAKHVPKIGQCSCYYGIRDFGRMLA